MYGILNIGFGSLLPHLVSFYGEVGISAETAAWAFSLYAVISFGARIGAGALGDRFDKQRLLQVAFATLAVGIFATGFASQTWHTVFFIVLIGAGYACGGVLIPALITDIYGPRAFALVFSFVIVPGALLAMLGPGIVGWGADISGSYQLAFWVLGVFTLLAIPAVSAAPTTAKAI